MNLQILRSLYRAFALLAIGGNIYLVSKGNKDWSLYFLVFTSIVLGVLGNLIFEKIKNTQFYNQSKNNANEAHRIILETENKFLPFLRKRNTRRLANQNLNDLEGDPVVWLICIFVFWIFFTSDTYTKFDVNDVFKFVSLIFMTLIQIFSLSYAISKMIVYFQNKIKAN